MDNAPLGWMSKQEFLKVLCLDLYLFKIYNNDLPDNLISNPKLLAGDTSLFSTVTDSNVTANQINNDLHITGAWAHQWKINFNPDTSKQAQEVIFGRKVKVTVHPQLVFNINRVRETATQKHPRMFLDFKLNFREHFENVLNKVNKTIELLQNYKILFLDYHY